MILNHSVQHILLKAWYLIGIVLYLVDMIVCDKFELWGGVYIVGMAFLSELTNDVWESFILSVLLFLLHAFSIALGVGSIFEYQFCIISSLLLWCCAQKYWNDLEAHTCTSILSLYKKIAYLKKTY